MWYAVVRGDAECREHVGRRWLVVRLPVAHFGIRDHPGTPAFGLGCHSASSFSSLTSTMLRRISNCLSRIVGASSNESSMLYGNQTVRKSGGAPMTLTQLRTFLAIVETGSVHGAADQLFVT